MLELKASAGLSLDLGPRRVPVDHFTNGVMADEAWIAREGLHGFGGYPLLVDDRLVGVLTMFSRAGLSHATLTALAIAAKQLALGIERKKADVVGYLAHDFNNLLTAIGVCVDLLKSRLAQGSLERHYVDDIDIAATRAADLTRLLQAVGGKTP
jgi:signal transduction histidine kinase